MATITNVPNCHRSVCVSSSSHGSSSSKSTATENGSHISAISAMNPFMTLVDAAASLLDKTSEIEAHKVFKNPDAAAKIPAAAEAVVVASIIPPSSENSSGKKQTFAEFLMTILEDPRYEDALTWMPDGKAFTIKNHKMFKRELMPKLFNIRNMSSFVRKLGRWGFSRVHEKVTGNSDIFKHPDFRKDDWEACCKIKCAKHPKAKPVPSLHKNSAVVDLAATENGMPTSQPNSCPVSTPQVGVAGMRCVHYGPSHVSPPTPSKVILRLELARLVPAQSRQSAIPVHDLENVTNEVVGAVFGTCRRDEETVVAMPKKYSAKHPGMRVISGSTFTSRFYPLEYSQAPSSVDHMIYQSRSYCPKSRNSICSRRVSLDSPAPNRVIFKTKGQQVVPRTWALKRTIFYPRRSQEQSGTKPVHV